MADVMDLYGTKVADTTALRLRLGDLKVDYRPIEAELREAMNTRLAESEEAGPRKRRRGRKG